MIFDENIGIDNLAINCNNIFSSCLPSIPSKNKTKQKGLSVHYLSTIFADEVKDYNNNSSKKSNNNTTRIRIYDLENLNNDENGLIRSKGEDITCPRDEEMGAAFVDCIQGEDNVGVANIMISYTWGDTVEDIIDGLEQFVLRKKLNPKRAYVWICCLCNNQHRVVDRRKNNEEVPFEEFKDIFESQVRDVDYIVALMSPWQNPLYLTRVWCIFEMHTAHKNNCDISIEMPSREREKLKSTVLKNPKAYDKLFDALGKTKIEHAEATVEADKVNILELVEAGGGTDSLNNDVNNLFRNWIFGSLNIFVSELDGQVKEENYGGEDPYYLENGYQNIGHIFRRSGEYKSAIDCYKSQNQLCKKEFGNTHIQTSNSYNNLAMVHKELKEYDEAIKLYKQFIAINKKAYGSDNVNVGTGYYNIGGVYIKKENWDTALEYYEQCRKIYENKYGKEHAQTALVYNNIGFVHREKGDYEKALTCFTNSLEIKKKTIENYEEHPNTAASYSNIGRVHQAKGDTEKALNYYSMALRIYEKVYGVNHHTTIIVYNYIRSAYKQKGESAKALEYSKKAKQAK
jgi:tetratricopeptide (TPR) repeat protein